MLKLKPPKAGLAGCTGHTAAAAVVVQGQPHAVVELSVMIEKNTVTHCATGIGLFVHHQASVCTALGQANARHQAYCRTGSGFRVRPWPEQEGNVASPFQLQWSKLSEDQV